MVNARAPSTREWCSCGTLAFGSVSVSIVGPFFVCAAVSRVRRGFSVLGDVGRLHCVGGRFVVAKVQRDRGQGGAVGLEGFKEVVGVDFVQLQCGQVPIPFRRGAIENLLALLG